MATSEALINSTIRHQVMLEGLKTGQAKRFENFLKRMDKSIRERLSTEELTSYSRSRLERLLSSVDKNLKTILDDYSEDLQADLVELGNYESEFEARNLFQAIESEAFEPVIPAPSQVKAALFSAPLSVRGADGGKLLKPFIQDWTQAERGRLVGAIRQGVFEGQTNSQIIQAIRGTRANRYTDGLLNISSRNAEAITRTAVQHVSTTARFETFKANDDILTGYRWLSTLDSRTSSQCRSLSNQVFEIDKGPRPPAHIRCRSTVIPELDGRYKFLSEGRTQSSIDGPVDANLTYYDWLKRQSNEFQDEVLGPKWAKLFRDGGLTAKRFSELSLDRNFKPITLEEMKRKEPQAFKNAFGEGAD